MEKIIKAAVEKGATDIHIKAGDVFRARIDGQLQPLTKQRLTPDQTKSIALGLISNETDRKRLEQLQDYHCSWGAPGIGRFRVAILRQRSSFMVIMRVIPFQVPTAEKLNLPRVIESIAKLEQGLILVTGRPGNGRSSTAAALIQLKNASTSCHIITIENPIEYLHRDLQGSVTQREVGVDTESYVVGLRSALRQDPDVVMVSEMLEADVVEAALSAAEDGKVVISTAPTEDALSTITRLISMFHPDQREKARVRLADALGAVISQRLLPRASGDGRVPVVEVLIGTPEARTILRERARLGELHDLMEKQRDDSGMQLFEQHLVDLVENQVITREVALSATSDTDSLAAKLP